MLHELLRRLVERVRTTQEIKLLRDLDDRLLEDMGIERRRIDVLVRGRH